MPSQQKPTKTYFVYIMTSASRVLYVGVTNNLSRRVWQHKNGRPAGFASRYRLNCLVYCETFGDIRDAIAREKELKGWLRFRKVALIQAANPSWRDLSNERCDLDAKAKPTERSLGR